VSGLRGEGALRHRLRRRALASMGPRHECRGEDIDPPPELLRLLASMGPRHECRGEGIPNYVLDPKSIALQWGHGTNAVERPRTSLPKTCFILLQWGHGTNAVERGRLQARRTAGQTSFNGATARMPWRGVWQPFRILGGRECFNGATARMPWRGARPCKGAPASPCFNGATARMPWRVILAFLHELRQISFNGATARMPWRECQNY